MSENKKYKIMVSDRAKHMLASHIRFAALVNKEAAALKKNEILTAIRSLSYMPMRYPLVDGAGIIPTRIYRKMYVKKWYLVLYRIEGDTVFVDFIYDCRQDNSDLIR